ncbi:hypothetical protein OC834_006023 [Tilletia horrida]|uniref:Uncharacterized protein n=1 Tax=Tilletia horrida TaxID=155126 RepID=A0AAN6JJ87_9BASI|nr:hypothetical protein OC834_006023 [Tilletia horrida]KAK0528561.1 hypothetical protein OC842_004515 [Tilletia horrida]
MDTNLNTASSNNGPVSLPASSLPHPLSQYAETLEPVFDNCGAMTSALHLLGDVETRLEQSALRDEKHRQAMHAKLRSDLQEVIKRVREEASEHGARIKQESIAHQERVHTQLDNMLQRFEAGLTDSDEHSKQGFTLLLAATKACNQQVRRTVTLGQRAWMRMQAQLVSFNAWAVAWPEAVRLSTQDDEDDGTVDHGHPPRYELRSLGPLIASGGPRTQGTDANNL